MAKTLLNLKNVTQCIGMEFSLPPSLLHLAHEKKLFNRGSANYLTNYLNKVHQKLPGGT